MYGCAIYYLNTNVNTVPFSSLPVRFAYICYLCLSKHPNPTMKKASSYTMVATTIAVLAVGVIFCYALNTHPYAVHYRIAKVVPSVKIEYPAKSVDYSSTFCDLQDRQMKAAKAVGVSSLPSTHEDLDNLADQLVRVKNCRAYTLAKMRDSEPYLRPNAQKSLELIGTSFRDSLKAKGLPSYRILVTSLLRTTSQAGDLTQKNGVAVANSCHCYGTTFDISYSQFEPLSIGKTMASEDLKKVLGEVLLDQRNAGNIYVKHEKQQPCFHITSRR